MLPIVDILPSLLHDPDVLVGGLGYLGGGGAHHGPDLLNAGHT